MEYNREEFTQKKCKTVVLNTAGVLHTFVLYNLLGPGTSFYRNVFLQNSLYKGRFLHFNV